MMMKTVPALKEFIILSDFYVSSLQIVIALQVYMDV